MVWAYCLPRFYPIRSFCRWSKQILPILQGAYFEFALQLYKVSFFSQAVDLIHFVLWNFYDLFFFLFCKTVTFQSLISQLYNKWNMNPFIQTQRYCCGWWNRTTAVQFAEQKVNAALICEASGFYFSHIWHLFAYKDICLSGRHKWIPIL